MKHSIIAKTYKKFRFGGLLIIFLIAFCFLSLPMNAAAQAAGQAVQWYYDGAWHNTPPPTPSAPATVPSTPSFTPLQQQFIQSGQSVIANQIQSLFRPSPQEVARQAALRRQQAEQAAEEARLAAERREQTYNRLMNSLKFGDAAVDLRDAKTLTVDPLRVKGLNLQGNLLQLKLGDPNQALNSPSTAGALQVPKNEDMKFLIPDKQDTALQVPQNEDSKFLFPEKPDKGQVTVADFRDFLVNPKVQDLAKRQLIAEATGDKKTAEEAQNDLANLAAEKGLILPKHDSELNEILKKHPELEPDIQKLWTKHQKDYEIQEHDRALEYLNKSLDDLKAQGIYDGQKVLKPEAFQQAVQNSIDRASLDLFPNGGLLDPTWKFDLNQLVQQAEKK